MLATTLKAGESAEYSAQKSRNLYLVPAAGSVEVNGVRVNARDGAAIRNEAKLTITALENFRTGAGRRGVAANAWTTPTQNSSCPGLTRASILLRETFFK